MRPLRVRLYLTLLAADLLCILVAFALAAVIRFGSVSVDVWADVSLAITALFLVIAILDGSYCLQVLCSPSTGTARAATSLLLSFLLFFLFCYFLKIDTALPRAITLLALVIATASLVILRVVAGDWMYQRYRGRFTNEVVLRDGPIGGSFSNYETIDVEEIGLRPVPSDASMLLMLAQLTRGADRLVIACRPEAAYSWAKMLRGVDVQGEILTWEYDSLAPTGIAQIDGRATLVVSAKPLNPRQKAAKRLLDLTTATVALTLLAPLFAIVALAIKLDSPGPVFFRQWRVGQGNQLFRIYKFRTMRTECTDEDGKVSMQRQDQRITRIGAFLRRTSIDELPQLINVVLNTMSLIGPRPHALGSLAGDRLFWQVDERYWDRHALKPGITGLAQVRGLRGSTETAEDLSARLRADLEYVSGWCLWRDITILVRTLKVVVHPNAY